MSAPLPYTYSSPDLEMMSIPTIRAWLGGSFDPVHQGHIAILSHVYHSLHTAFPHYPIIANFLPTAGSPLKDQPTAQHDRLTMLSLALQEAPYLSIDTSELSRTPPIFTFDTLSEFQVRYPHDIRIFIMGADSALSLSKWYRGIDLIGLANLWIIPRPSLTTNAHDTQQQLRHGLLEQLDPKLKKYVTFDIKDLINPSMPHIYIDRISPPAVASRDIRTWLSEPNFYSNSAVIDALPKAVIDYIAKNDLYQPFDEHKV